MNLSPQQKSICEHVLNVFETGSIGGNYSALSIFDDGPHRERQVTYGRSQTTEYGNLGKLVKMYINSKGMFSGQLAKFVDKIGVEPLVDNDEFKKLLKDAGKQDPVMRQVQDVFFDQVYLQPALKWATDQEFFLPLSALVIYDSYIHSGGILSFLRKRFPEHVPSNGGPEKEWIKAYVAARHNWLANHSNPDLRKTIYRTKCFTKEIERDNWDLSKLPIDANGVEVSG
jgi:chitosanase